MVFVLFDMCYQCTVEVGWCWECTPLVNIRFKTYIPIPVLQGFPESCLQYRSFSNSGLDDRLDVAISLLCIGLYPNVCVYKDKRKVLCESRPALIHKSSVNCPFGSKDCKFPTPFFVFGEKVVIVVHTIYFLMSTTCLFVVLIPKLTSVPLLFNTFYYDKHYRYISWLLNVVYRFVQELSAPNKWQW